MEEVLVAGTRRPAGRQRPGTLAARRRARLPWLARTALDLTVRMLPAAHRERYALEFYADVLSLPRREQVRHVLSVLVHVQQLAWALGEASPEVEGRSSRLAAR